MIFDLGGIKGEVRNPSALRDAQRNSLSRFETTGPADFRLTVEPAPLSLPATVTGTTITWPDTTAVVRNAGFTGTIDIAAGDARFHGTIDEAWPLHLMLRTTASVFLPLLGWIPLHAAAVELDGAVVVFAGPSGAGKTTLASTSPHIVLGDEMVLVSTDGLRAAPTVFWGDSTLRPVAPPAGNALRAIVQLEKGDRFSFRWLTPRRATAALVATVLTPLAPLTSTPITKAIAAMVESTPLAAMAWHPSSPPWPDLQRALSHG